MRQHGVRTYHGGGTLDRGLVEPLAGAIVGEHVVVVRSAAMHHAAIKRLRERRVHRRGEFRVVMVVVMVVVVVVLVVIIAVSVVVVLVVPVERLDAEKRPMRWHGCDFLDGATMHERTRALEKLQLRCRERREHLAVCVGRFAGASGLDVLQHEADHARGDSVAHAFRCLLYIWVCMCFFHWKKREDK